VIAPSVNVIAGVVVGLATEPDTPLAVTTETLETEPPDGAIHDLTPAVVELKMNPVVAGFPSADS